MKKRVCECHLSFHTAQNPNCTKSDTFERILKDDFPEEKYRSRGPTEDKTTIHYGQRKLHLSEVEFLSIITEELELKKQKVVMIYAGAAPGVHIDHLSRMFPFIEFVLVDPNPFKIKNVPPRITIYNEYFTDDMAKKFAVQYADYVRLFVSDIRTGDPSKMDANKVETQVDTDMIWQMNWYRIMTPALTMLKFRLPYVGDIPDRKKTLEYLDGDVYFQIWAPQSSSETRLVVRPDAKMKVYDCVKYENQLFRFNIMERVMCYPHDVVNVMGIDCCYDCRAEIYVHEKYNNVVPKINKLCELNDIKGYNGKPVRIMTKSMRDYIIDLNKQVHADARRFKVVYAKKTYEIKFNDIRYGDLPSDVLRRAK